MPRVVMGTVDTSAQAEITLERLRASGFAPEDVSVLFPDARASHDLAFEHHTKAPEGALAGAGLGAVLGGILGITVGVGVLAPPGLGMLVAAGPVLAALSAAAVLALLFGVAGALAGVRIPEIEAKAYDGKVRTGRILVGVHAPSHDAAARARQVLRSVAASDVSATAEAPVPLRART